MSRDPAMPGGDASWRDCEAVIDRFESAWHEHGTPDIAGFLPPPAAPRRAHLLRELIKIDLEYRWGRGLPMRVEEYARLFPELAAPDLPADLIAEEVYVRRQLGQAPTIDELRERFPSQAAELEALGLGRAAAVLTGGAGQETIWDEPLVAEAAPAPRRLGRYELRGRVGRGAFADVHRAWDPALRREVALKVSREDGGDADLHARILHEARSAARLRHPAIVPIHEAGEADGRAYIAYELIPGPTLAALLRTQRPPLDQAAAWIARLADALDYAHRAGVIHRDVKPSNVMMDQHGEPVLADFGLARLAEAGGTLTGRGDVLGTPGYMAPEQAAGRGHEADARADVYALGAVLYELLTGRRPFEGQGTAVVHRVLHEEPPLPSRLRSGVPADLETICLKAMAKEPGRRYASAAALADDLRRYLARRPIRARRIGPGGWLALWCRRNPGTGLTIALAVAAVLLVVAVAFCEVLRERDRYRAERDRAETNLYRALLGEARSHMKVRDTGWWWEATENLREAAALAPADQGRAALRDLAAACLGTEYPCFRQRSACSGLSCPVTAVALHPGGRVLASAAADGTVRLWSTLQGRALAVLRADAAAITTVAFHPAGQRLISLSAAGVVRSWDVSRPDQASALEAVGELRSRSVTALAFAADGAWLAVAEKQGTVILMPLTAAGDLASPGARRTLIGHTGPVRCLAFGPSGRTLATGAEDKTVRLWDVATARQTLTWPLSNVPTDLAFTPNGDALAVADRETHGIHLRGVLGGPVFTQPHMHTASVNQVTFDGAGRLLTASSDGSVRLWRRQGGPGSWEERAVADAGVGPSSCMALDKAGRWLVVGYADGRVRVWELVEPLARNLIWPWSQSAVFLGDTRRLVNGSREYDFATASVTSGRIYEPPPIPDAVWGVAATLDGRWVATAGHDRLVKIWDGRTLKLVRTLEGHRDVVWCVAFSPDGRTLASGGDDHAVHLWDVSTGRLRQRLAGHAGMVTSVAFHPNGRWLVSTSSDGAVTLWDTGSAAPIAFLRSGGPPAHQAAFRPDGSWLVVACEDRRLLLWDLTRGLPAPGAFPTRVLADPAGALWSVAWSADGQTLASGGDGGRIALWDGATFARLVTMQSRKGQVRGLAFSQDGQLLAGSAYVSPTVVWNLPILRQGLRDLGLDW